MAHYTDHLSTENCSVVLVDFLDGFMPGLRTMESERFERNVNGFCHTVLTLGLPHCVLGDEGGFRGSFFPVIKEHFGDSPTFGRHTPSACRSGGFRDWAEGQMSAGRKKIVLGGISIDNCSMLTTLDLLAAGFEAYVVVDVCGADSHLTETAAIHRLVQAGATPINWAQFACESMGDWQSEHGEAIGRLLSEYSTYGALGVPKPE